MGDKLGGCGLGPISLSEHLGKLRLCLAFCLDRKSFLEWSFVCLPRAPEWWRHWTRTDSTIAYLHELPVPARGSTFPCVFPRCGVGGSLVCCLASPML